jgi:alkylation response protein AidB-like acyl-CoA dehydrogenase
MQQAKDATTLRSGASTGEEARQVAEEARQTEWAGKGLLRDLFLGRFQLGLVHPFPTSEERPEFAKYYRDLGDFLREKVSPAGIDESGEYPPEVIDGLRRLGAFGMKIPKEYGGLGFSIYEYCAAMELVGSHDSNVFALLSAHQSIGVPQPLKIFGTREQKEKYLPLCAAGAISAFALTEKNVGSDPSSIGTTAVWDGESYVLNGEKLWCTNGTLAELLVVMAVQPPGTGAPSAEGAPDKGKRISAFVVETSTPGVTIERRCRFMGLRALGNGVISFKDVKVPRENLIGKEGQGLKIALTTLNTGRLTIPAGAGAMAKQCLEIVRGWTRDRVQWGAPLWKHEAVSHRIADMAATTFAMDSVWKLTSQMADRGGYDIRLEAAAAKEWNSTRQWEIVDAALQIRGGRGYETEASLEARGEGGIGIERLMRDARINRIFEGSSEIMHLFMAREAVDKHLKVAGAVIDPGKKLGAKLLALPGIVLFYAGWYPPLWLKGALNPFRYRDWGSLGTHLRFVERSSRKLARESFHAMSVYQAGLEKHQGFLFRWVDLAMELFAMAASVSHARHLQDVGDPDAPKALAATELFCCEARGRVRRLFQDMWRNDDVQRNRLTAQVMSGDEAWLGAGTLVLAAPPLGRKEAAITSPTFVR